MFKYLLGFLFLALLVIPTTTVEAASSQNTTSRVCTPVKVWSSKKRYKIVRRCRLVQRRINYVQKPVTNSNIDSLKAQAKAYLESKGLGSHWTAFDFIISKESGWNVNARNKSSGACGLGQALPCSKTLSTHPDYLTNPISQVDWALNYMVKRYGSPSQAYSFWVANRWY